MVSVLAAPLVCTVVSWWLKALVMRAVICKSGCGFRQKLDVFLVRVYCSAAASNYVVWGMAIIATQSQPMPSENNMSATKVPRLILIVSNIVC